jgi:hypothetical protein
MHRRLGAKNAAIIGICDDAREKAEEGTYTVHVQKVPEGYAACKDEFEVPQNFGDVKIILNKG